MATPDSQTGLARLRVDPPADQLLPDEFVRAVREGRGRAIRYVRQLQAAIAALHAHAPSVEETDWTQIAALYTALLPIWSSPSVRIGHAVAVGMADGPDAGLAALDRLDDDDSSRLLAARGHLLERAGRSREAMASFESAAESTRHPLEAERLRRRAHDTRKPH